MALPSSGPRMNDLNQGFGALLFMAFPVVAAAKITVGLPLLAGGIVATGVSAAAYGSEQVVRQISSAVQESPEIALQREAIAQKFAERLLLILQPLEESNYPVCQFLKQNPQELIRIGLISTAFIAKNLLGKTLYIESRTITRGDIREQNADHKKYFDTVCEMKSAIRRLRLSPDDDHAWTTLMDLLGKYEEPKENLSLSQIERENVGILYELSLQLSSAIAQDETFLRCWASFTA